MSRMRTFLHKAKNWYSLTRDCTRQAEAEQEALWQLKDRSFSQVTRELGVGYTTLRRLLEREIDEEALGPIIHEEEIYLGIDEHSFKHQELVHMVTEVKKGVYWEYLGMTASPPLKIS